MFFIFSYSVTIVPVDKKNDTKDKDKDKQFGPKEAHANVNAHGNVQRFSINNSEFLN